MVFGLWFLCSQVRVGYNQVYCVQETKTKQSDHLQLDRGQCYFNACTLAPLLRRRHPLSSRFCVTSINPGGSGTLCTRRGPGMGERSVGLRLWGLTSVKLKNTVFLGLF